MKTIYKYQLTTTDVQIIQMPFNAEVLTVQIQHGEPMLWARVESANSTEAKRIYIVGTGNPMPPGCGRYVGTYQLRNGSLVFHVFEEAFHGFTEAHK